MSDVSDVLHVEMSYCTLCDKYFPCNETRGQHVQMSPNHPQCVPCNRRFLNKNSLRNHYVYSPRHHYCVVCEKSFKTAGGFRMHVEYAAVHRDDSDDDDDESEMEEPPDGWEDEYGKIEFPDEEGEDTDDDLSWEEYDECDIEGEDEPHDPLAISLDSTESDSSKSDAISSHSDNVKQSSQDSSLASYDCPLCLDTTKALSVTRCGHIFCTSCIQRVFRTKRLCPVCRQPGSLKQLRKIYPTFA